MVESSLIGRSAEMRRRRNEKLSNDCRPTMKQLWRLQLEGYVEETNVVVLFKISFLFSSLSTVTQAGRKGMPPYSAMLSDPNAVPNDAVKNGVGSVLQTISMALLEGVDRHEETMIKMAETIVKEGGDDYSEGVIASLAYLRDRVGVPRDMRLPAARQLRAHLNWAIAKILRAQS